MLGIVLLIVVLIENKSISLKENLIVSIYNEIHVHDFAMLTPKS